LLDFSAAYACLPLEIDDYDRNQAVVAKREEVLSGSKRKIVVAHVGIKKRG
jgi:hypothetical protein